ncbi:MAG: Tn3 family transposase [Acidobacteriaceae bacterium]|nr:Tn3 family transposase [Acidobacteriaceae bacterium]
MRVDGNRLRISPAKGRVPEDVALWSGRAYDLLPRIAVPNLLMEVDSWTGFSRCFTDLLHGDPARDRSALMAVILADATQFGPEQDGGDLLGAFRGTPALDVGLARARGDVCQGSRRGCEPAAPDSIGLLLAPGQHLPRTDKRFPSPLVNL